MDISVVTAGEFLMHEATDAKRMRETDVVWQQMKSKVMETWSSYFFLTTTSFLTFDDFFPNHHTTRTSYHTSQFLQKNHSLFLPNATPNNLRKPCVSSLLFICIHHPPSKITNISPYKRTPNTNATATASYF